MSHLQLASHRLTTHPSDTDLALIHAGAAGAAQISAPMYPPASLPDGCAPGSICIEALSTADLRDIVARRRHPFEFVIGGAR